VVESLEDLQTYFTDFGVAADFGGFSVTGIYEHGYIEVLGVASFSPTFTAPSQSLSTVTVNQTVTIEAQLHTVVDIQPDGTGVTLLILSTN